MESLLNARRDGHVLRDERLFGEVCRDLWIASGVEAKALY